jgi:hypothetical protein
MSISKSSNPAAAKSDTSSASSKIAIDAAPASAAGAASAATAPLSTIPQSLINTLRERLLALRRYL